MLLMVIICHIRMLNSGKGKDDYHVMAYDKESPEWTMNGEHNLIAIYVYTNMCATSTVS